MMTEQKRRELQSYAKDKLAMFIELLPYHGERIVTNITDMQLVHYVRAQKRREKSYQ